MTISYAYEQGHRDGVYHGVEAIYSWIYDNIPIVLLYLTSDEKQELAEGKIPPERGTTQLGEV